MIAMTISGCCNGCKYIDLVLERVFVPGNYELHCEHENVCGRLEEEARRRALKPDWEE